MDGTHRFAATLAEHNRNAAASHRALDSQTRSTSLCHRILHPGPSPSGPAVLMLFLCISYVVFMFKT